MTYPGWAGVVGPPPATTTGGQVRQSRAGKPAGGYTTTVLDAMGSYAPAWGITAEGVTVEQEMAANPHEIEKGNFELPASEGGTKQFGVDESDPAFVNNADPGYHGD